MILLRGRVHAHLLSEHQSLRVCISYRGPQAYVDKRR